MTKFNVGDSVKVICECDVLRCKTYHGKVGVICYISINKSVFNVKFETEDHYAFFQNELTSNTKEKIKNELKGMLE